MDIEIQPADTGRRLDQFLAELQPQLSRGAVQRAIKAGFCLVDGKAAIQPSFKLKKGQKLVFQFPETSSNLAAGKADLEIIWEDSQLAVINKPAGLVVHPCPSCQLETVAHKLLAHFDQLAKIGGERPGIVHRLDKDTSGLLLVALTEAAGLALTEAFGQREIGKEYLALVYGQPPETGEIDEPIGRHASSKIKMAVTPLSHGGKEARSQWRKLWQGKNIALLAVRIFTGRTHQIRVHLAHAGWPLLGDKLYAPQGIASLAPRQMLHAWKLELRHPFTGEELRFTQAPPEDFFDAVYANEPFWLPLVVTGNQGCGKSAFCAIAAKMGKPCCSADAIVSRLYAAKGEAAAWIGSNLGMDLLLPTGEVNKPKLFELFQSKPHLRHELEKVVHGLVLEQIETFWRQGKESGQPFAVAEIPLYFESRINSELAFSPFVVGISCPKEQRWQRIMANRGWSLAKTREIESWQWPEDRKMAACDEIIENNGTEKDLCQGAEAFWDKMSARVKNYRDDLLARLKKLCAA